MPQPGHLHKREVSPMPWQELSRMDRRLQFVLECLSGRFTMTELAEQYHVSRKTGYKWVQRFEAYGREGLVDVSRRPHTSPQATDPDLVKAIVAARKRHPRWGAKKLLAILARQQPGRAWPARSTVSDVLRREGLITRRRRARRLADGRPPLVPITRPNEVWTVDFKGEFLTGDGVYCYPLTVRDGFSRFVLRCDGLLSTASAPARDRFERTFAEYGLPERIRSDNGSPFGGPGLAGLSRLSVWWMRLAILPERIAKGHPEQNGSHEQFHSVLKAETARPPAANREAQQRRFRRFCREYNHERPHEALANAVPATRYSASPRPFPRQLPSLDYPGHFEVRRVRANGDIKWGGEPLFLSDVLKGQDVGLEEVDDGVWTLYFATVALARIDVRTRMLQPLR
jgi:putative transposase